MSEFELVIGNKNYSSWSFRAWLVMARAGVPFDETVLALGTDEAIAAKLRHSPAARVPVLHHGDVTVWDSLAIAEYVAELFPDREFWPSDSVARARARSICAEMHSGLEHLRRELPMNCRVRRERRARSGGLQRDIDRVLDCWRDTRARFGGDGPFLFGQFSIADAFFAPVASRFFTYDIEIDDNGAQYMEAVFCLPEVQRWMSDAESEPMTIPAYDDAE